MEGKLNIDPQVADVSVEPGRWLYDMDELRGIVANIEELRKHIGDVNPRPPGRHNDLIQIPKKLLARSLAWYTRSLQKFNASVSRALGELFYAVETLAANMVALDRRFQQSEKRMATQKDSMQEQLELLQEQVNALISLQRTANAEVLTAGMEKDREEGRDDSRLAIPTKLGNDRTFYVIGLFGTGRLYINDVIVRNIGERARHFRDQIRLHPGPTSMIYSGHVTIRHVSRAQSLPVVMKGILESVRSGFADSAFVYRHPLDSLLTNWIWWRTYLRDNRAISGISEVYKNIDDLCSDLEQNFVEFKTFAEGDPGFFTGLPGPRFLSFSEFVEETALHLRSATLALRLEDFMIDPLKEFSKIAEVMSVDLDLSRLRVVPPRTTPYRYLAVIDKAPRFKSFIDGLDADTKRRIENIGYGIWRNNT